MDIKLLIIDDEEEICYGITRLLERYKDIIVDSAYSGGEGIEKFSKENHDIVITDLILGKMNGLEVIERVKKINENTIVIMITGKGGDDTAEQAIKMGAYDYFSKPFNNTEFFKTIRNAKEKIELERYKEQQQKSFSTYHKFSYKNEEIKAMLTTLSKIAKFDTPILITGESGSGKGQLAESIHLDSNRADKPFIKLNCGAIPENLIEAELFGYEKGAFTGASSSKKGKLELADGGTIFLDEIGEIDIKYQAKLLRVLEEGILEKVGSQIFKKIDVRIISATNVNLEKAIEEKRFRLDLFYRLNGFNVVLPPLKNRKEDIIYLSELFIEELCKKFSLEKKVMSDKLKTILLSYEWPGNIRELKNIAQNLIILSGDNIVLSHEHLPPQFFKAAEVVNPIIEEEIPLKDFMKRQEKWYIEKILKKYGDNKTEMAKLLGISRKTLYERFTELGIKF